nr:hypothetical protein [Angustibacter aerolatus]
MTSVPSAQRVARRHLGRLYRGALRRALAPAALPAPRDLRRQQQEVDGLRREVQAAHRRLAELGASLDALPSPEQRRRPPPTSSGASRRSTCCWAPTATGAPACCATTRRSRWPGR